MQTKPVLGVIGGSGLYNIPGLQDAQSFEIETPFGSPSSPVVIGKLAGQPVAFLARHGLGHWITPSEINYRANIYALKIIGVSQVISVSACGSLREDYAPGDIVVPDQIYDHTHLRRRSFFGEGLVAHVGVAEPFCPALSRQVGDAVTRAGGKLHRGGSLIVIEGPRFSTRAESNVYRSWGLSLIGMTAAPEAFLAREAELCYASMSHVTDYDVWHQSAEPVSVEAVIAVLHQNTQIAQQAILALLQSPSPKPACECGTALAKALITDPQRIPAETRARLDALVGKYYPTPGS